MTFCQYKCGTDLKPYDRDDKKTPRYELDGTKHDYARCMEIKNSGGSAKQEFVNSANRAVNSSFSDKNDLAKLHEKVDLVLSGNAEILRQVEGFFAAWQAEGGYKKASELVLEQQEEE